MTNVELSLVERLNNLASRFERRFIVHEDVAVRTLREAAARIEALEKALDRLLETSGARGRYHALEYADAVEKAEKLLALSTLSPARMRDTE